MVGLPLTLEHLGLLADATRLRLLALLTRQELSVVELTAITGLAQSRVSTHLGRLREAGLLRDRRVGASTFYARVEGELPPPAGDLWALLERLVDDDVLQEDRRRAEDLVRARDNPAGWPDSIAGQLDRHYSPGRTWEATARGLCALVSLGDVLDVGAGDGVLASLLAPRARTYTCLDRSPRMVAAASVRLAEHAGVRVVEGDMHALPFPEASFDTALCFNVLTYAVKPKTALAEAARVLRPGGTLVVVTLSRHRHDAITRAYSHVNTGFAPAELARLIRGAGLLVEQCAVTSRERQMPCFEVVTAVGRRLAGKRAARVRHRETRLG